MPNDYITLLHLENHPEGGYFREIYKSTDEVKVLKKSDLSLVKQNSAGTFIYFLLHGHDFSAWHTLQSDEIWHYYDGSSPLYIHTIDEQGQLHTHLLGNPRLTPGACFQVVIKAGLWFAAEVVNKASFALVGCTVSPGFEYEDFKLAHRKNLLQQFPHHTTMISKFTYDDKKKDTYDEKEKNNTVPMPS